MVLDDNAERKLQHIDVVLKEDVEGPLTTLLECVHIPHQALIDAGPEDVDTRVKFLGKKLSVPLIISGMTGGAPGTEKINAALASIAEEEGLALGVGSQRAALENPNLEYTFKVVREVAPTAPVIANIGAAEVVKYPPARVLKAVEMIDADALAVHLNLAQEAAQPEGTPSMRGIIKSLEKLVLESPVPVIVKEVGNGLSKEVVSTLKSVGIKHFDVEGAGGTNWVKVEMYRAMKAGDRVKEGIARNLLTWGIPTAASIIEVRNAAPNAYIIGSGGIRTAVDAVKAIVIGADVAGMALPFLKAYASGRLREFTKALIHSFRMAVLMAGARNMEELKRLKPIITPPLTHWVSTRGLKPGHYLTY